MIDLTKQSQRLMKSMESWAGREPEAESLAIVDVAGVLLRMVRAFAPEVDGEDYANELEVLFVPGEPPMAGVIHPGKSKKISPVEADSSLVYIVPRDKGVAPGQSQGGSSKSASWVKVLATYNPWPFSMVPAGVDEHATLVVRRVSEGEVNQASLRLKGVAPRIESELRGVGVVGVLIGRQVKGISGSDVHLDLAFSVLRVEYGYNEAQRAHWRPALRALESEITPAQRAFIAYILHGRTSAFSVPAREVSREALSQADKTGFGDRVGKSVGLEKA